MFVSLPIFLQDVDAHGQVFASAALGDDWPSLLCAQFPNPASPLLLVLGQVLGVFGRRAGSVGGFPHSDALRSSNITWDATNPGRWLAGLDQ